MSSFTLEAWKAKYLADALIAGAAKDGFTPVIHAAELTIASGSVAGVATDRYRVHRVELAVEAGSRAGSFVASLDTLRWISRNAKTFDTRRNVAKTFVTVTHKDGDEGGIITVKVREDGGAYARTLTYVDRGVPGKFPPVARLVVEARAADSVEAPPAMLRLDYLASLRALSLTANPSVQLQYRASKNSNKPGPAYVAFANGGAPYAEALIQPFLEIKP